LQADTSPMRTSTLSFALVGSVVAKRKLDNVQRERLQVQAFQTAVCACTGFAQHLPSKWR